jgi:hypothetical protein
MPYIDPGSGTLLIQVAVAAILAGAVLARKIWGKTFGWAIGLFRRHKENGKMTRGSELPSSWRDPSGFVFIHDNKIHRAVTEQYAADYELLMESG